MTALTSDKVEFRRKYCYKVRSFSTSPRTQQLVKAPIQVFGVDGRYASALYSAASKQKSLETVEKDLIKFQNLMKKDAKLDEFIRNPSIQRKDKAVAMKAIASKVGLNAATSNAMVLMAENGRLSKLNQVVNTFKLLMAATRGEVVCEVITAKPIDPEMKNKIEAALKGFMKQGQTILLTSKVDPSIMGGMIVSIGDKYVDMSVASKIKKYTQILEAAV